MRVTSTGTVQVAVRPAESCAVQVTVVSPVENNEPAAGSHVVVSGGDPPVTVGDGNCTGTGEPFGDSAETFDGHVMVGPLAGPLGECPPHAVAAAHARNTSTVRARTPARRLAAKKDDIKGMTDWL
jgi:hypothetical protein